MSTLLIIARDRHIGSRVIQTFKHGPFGRVFEAGLYKKFIPSAFARIKSVFPKFSKLGGAEAPLSPGPRPVRLNLGSDKINLIRIKFPPWRDNEADVSSVSPLPERITQLLAFFFVSSCPISSHLVLIIFLYLSAKMHWLASEHANKDMERGGFLDAFMYGPNASAVYICSSSSTYRFFLHG